MSILKKGMRGVPVKRLQERLGIDSDGIYGPGTEKAVREYQASAGLAADGIAGPDTFTALGLNELVLLRVGTRGAAVKTLQAALGVEADGRFGPGTEKAVRAFQEANGLDVDGMAGPATLAKIDAFPDVTETTVELAAVQPGEESFDGEPMPGRRGRGAAPAAGRPSRPPPGRSRAPRSARGRPRGPSRSACGRIRASPPVGAEARVHPPRLEVAADRAGRDLAVGVLARQPDLDVVGLPRAEAHVAGAEHDGAVGQAQRLEDASAQAVMRSCSASGCPRDG
jgi:hypothetical protein